ncbi:MAG: serine hydrolase domain-containing protein [Candidatus Thorarchaeota archaeon]
MDRKVMKKSNPATLISICALLVMIGLLTPFSAAAGTEIVSSYVEDEIQRIVNEGDIPSLHVCVVSNDEINWVKAFGEQTSPDTVFLIGSIQKVLVAVSILQLDEQGIINLDNDIDDYLPFSMRNPEFPDTAITSRILLSHSSGVWGHIMAEFYYDWQGLYYPEYPRESYPSVIGITLGDFLKECFTPDGSYYSSSNWLFEPGEKYSYSNTGYKILMFLLETVSNQTISEYMKDNIFGPLRMNNTGFNASDYEGHHAIPHTHRVDDPTNVELPIWNGEYMIRSTARDLGNLLIALMNEGEFDGYQLLQPDTIEMMSRKEPNLRSGINLLFKEKRWEGYGLGLETASHGLLGHGGSTIGFTAECYFNPDKKVGFVRLSNVNAILDYRSDEWQQIGGNTTEIRTLVMTHIGLLPPVDWLVVISGSIAVIVVLNIIRIRRKPRKTVPAVSNEVPPPPE